jgi:uncharacterized repeat protein (TIGR02543 family)
MKRISAIAIGALALAILTPVSSFAGSSSWSSDSIYGCVGTSIAPFVTKSEASAPFSVSSGALPAGLAMDPNTGEITGTPTATYSSTFTITSTDGDYPTATFSALIDTTCRPTVTDITPNHGSTAGGTSISIVGTGFQSDATVSIDDAGTLIPLTVTSRTDSTRILATTPAFSTIGGTTLVIRNGDGSRLRIANGFTYEEPVTVSMFEIGGSTPITTLTAAHYVHVPAEGDGKYAAIALTGFESSTANHINLNFPVASGSAYNQLLYNTQNCNITPVVEVLNTAPPGSPNTPGTIYKTLVVRTGVYVGGAPYQCVPVGTYSMRLHVYDTQGKDAYFDFTLVETPGPATQFLQPLVNGAPSFGTLRVGVPMAENPDFPESGFGLRVDGDSASFTVGTSALIPNLTVNFMSGGKGGGGSYYISGTPSTSGPYAFTITATVAGATPSTYEHEFTGLVRYVDSSTATFSGNGSTSGSMAAQVTDYKSPLNANLFARTGYLFNGWNTNANGSGTAYLDGAFYEFGTNVTLYAQWTLIPPASHTITFNGNGSTGGSTPPQTAAGTTVISSNGFSRTGFTFHGWRTGPNGGLEFDPGDSYSFNADITLYVEWSAIPVATAPAEIVASTYRVTFNANGASGTMASVTLIGGAKLPPLTYIREGYIFDHWSTVATSDGTLIDDKGEFTLRTDVTLYAHWSPKLNFIVSANQPIDLQLDNSVATTIGIFLQTQAGASVGVIVDIPRGLVGLTGSIRITPMTSDSNTANGVTNLKVQILDSFGQVVPQLLAPLTMHFQNSLGELVVASSEDGYIWNPVPLIQGTTLPEGQSTGYYLDSAGNVVVLTSHLTEFGLKLVQPVPLQLTTTSTTISTTKITSLATSGGSGSGSIKFSVLTPEYCEITSSGIVTGKKVGECQIKATKGGDVGYLHSDSEVMALTVEAEEVRVQSETTKLSITGTNEVRKVNINLGKLQAFKKVSVKAQSSSLIGWKTLATLKLDAKGRASAKLAFAAKSTVRLYVENKLMASLVMVR